MKQKVRCEVFTSLPHLTEQKKKHQNCMKQKIFIQIIKAFFPLRFYFY